MTGATEDAKDVLEITKENHAMRTNILRICKALEGVKSETEENLVLIGGQESCDDSRDRGLVTGIMHGTSDYRLKLTPDGQRHLDAARISGHVI